MFDASSAITKLLKKRLLTWLVALLIFNGFAFLSISVGTPIAYYMLPALGAIAAIGLLWLGHRSRTKAEHIQINENQEGRHRRFLVLLIVLSVLISGWQSLAAPPHRIIDTWEYFIGSDQLLGYAHTYTDPEHPGYFQDGIITYGYPLFIALHRLIGGDFTLLILVQHIFRVSTVIAVFLIIRQFDITLAKVTGLLLALSPITANNAHLMLTEGLYAPLVVLLAFITVLATKKKAVGFFALIGILAAIIAWIRPAGSYLIVPISTLLFFTIHQRKKLVVVLASLVITLLGISLGRWIIDRNFTFQTTATGIYYYSTIIFHDLYQNTNGPVTTEFSAAVQTSNCETDIESLKQRYPSTSRTLDLERTIHADDVLACIAVANPEIANRQTAMLIEAIRAKPFQFALSFFDEFMYYLSQIEINILWQSTDPPICDKEYALAAYNYDDGTHDRFRAYACTFDVPENAAIQNNFASYNVTFLFLSQPYLALNLLYSSVAVTFAGACVMVGFIWIEGSPRWRLLLLSVITIILYHAILSGIFYTIPRYVMVLNGLFLVVASMFYAIIVPHIAKSLHNMIHRRPATQ